MSILLLLSWGNQDSTRIIIISSHKDINTQPALLAWLYSQSNKVVSFSCSGLISLWHHYTATLTHSSNILRGRHGGVLKIFGDISPFLLITFYDYSRGVWDWLVFLKILIQVFILAIQIHPHHPPPLFLLATVSGISYQGSFVGVTEVASSQN